MFERSSRVPWLAILLAVALLVRLGAAIGVQQRVAAAPNRLCLIEGDAQGYWELARNIVRGDPYCIYGRCVLRMPGFPLFLSAGMLTLGENVLAIRFLLAGVGTVACGLVYWLARELFDRGTALRACLVAALMPTFIVFSVLLLSETLFATCMLGSLIAMTKLLKLHGSLQPRDSSSSPVLAATLSGLLIGLATLVRPTWLLVGPGFVVLDVLTAHDRRRAVRHGGIVLAALGATLLPWTLRNARVTGHFVPTTLWAGPSLYDGLNPQATGASDMSFVERDGIYARLPEYDADRHYRDASIEFVRAHPGRAAELALIKLWRFWSPAPNAAQFNHWAIYWPVALCSLAILGLATRGGWRVRRSLWLWLVPAGPVLYFTLIHAVFVGSLRYRLPAEYPLLVLTAVGAGAGLGADPRVAARGHGGATGQGPVCHS